MRLQGIPERFWIVTNPTLASDLNDCCFDVDFRQFALQIRGGLEIENIVGIYADEQAARNTAMELLGEGNDSVIYPSPWPDWFATQENRRSVSICDRVSGEKVEVQPPESWGKNWAWNIAEDGTGIVMRRTI